jgi:hypothetical protein
MTINMASCENCTNDSYWICWNTTTTPHTEHRYCDEHAAQAEEAGWTYQRLETGEQNAARTTWSGMGVGAN